MITAGVIGPLRCILNKSLRIDQSYTIGSTPNAWKLTVEVPPPCVAGNSAQNTTENKTLDHAIQRLCQLSLVDTDGKDEKICEVIVILG